MMYCERCVYGSGRHAEFCDSAGAIALKEVREFDSRIREGTSRVIAAYGSDMAWVKASNYIRYRLTGCGANTK